jgi:hypothetical protein
MVQVKPANSTILSSEPHYIETPEYRRLVYKMFRKEGERHPGGRLYRVPAIRAWQMTRRYVEAIR